MFGIAREIGRAPSRGDRDPAFDVQLECYAAGMSFDAGSARNVQRVTSRNAWFQKAEAVKRNRKKRWQHRLFFVEDVRSLNELLRTRRDACDDRQLDLLRVHRGAGIESLCDPRNGTLIRRTLLPRR